MALCCRLPHGRLYFDIPADDFWRDEPATFLEMIAPPPLTAVLDQVIGEDVRLSGVQPRTVPGPETECGYTTWHRVRETPIPWACRSADAGLT